MRCPHCSFVNAGAHLFCSGCGAPLTEEERRDPLIGRSLIGQFRIRQKIGEGGFGAVYLAEQPSMGRQVAIKILHQHLSYRAELAKRFHREGLAASRLEHPSAVTMYNFGETEDGILWIAMEHLQGQTLSARIKQQRLSPKELLDILRPICEVLYEAHQKGIIHRDLKPENIFLAQSASEKITPKLLDFGIAGLLESRGTQSNAISGTPCYMPPEQWRGLRHTDVRTDIYALGLIVYQGLTAKLPFEADSAHEWMQRHCMEEPRPLLDHLELNEVSRSLHAIVMRAISKEPNTRPQSALELLRALEAAVEGAALSPVSAGPTSPHQRRSWLGSYQDVQLLSQGDSFWVYQASWEGTPVRIKAPAPRPKPPWISWQQTTSLDGVTRSNATQVALDDAASMSALQAALLREQTVIRSTNKHWNHQVIALDNWSLGGFSIALITQDHQGKTFNTLPQEERRLLFPRMLLALWKSLSQTPHGALSEDCLFIAPDASRFVIADPGILLWQELTTESGHSREALLLSERPHYPILAPFEDIDDLATALQHPETLGHLSIPKTPSSERPLASDIMALGFVYYRLLTGEGLFLGEVLPQPAWLGERSSVEPKDAEGRLAYEAVSQALQRKYVSQAINKYRHITPREAALVEALILFRIKTIGALIAHLW